MKWWRSWPENIVSMQIFPSASFIWLFISVYWKNWIMSNASNLNSSGCSHIFSSSLLVKSRKRLACEVFDAIATHASLVNKGGITELFATKLGMVVHMHRSWARVSSENVGLLHVFKVKVTVRTHSQTLTVSTIFSGQPVSEACCKQSGHILTCSLWCKYHWAHNRG